jgi:hypothetical protein
MKKHLAAVRLVDRDEVTEAVELPEELRLSLGAIAGVTREGLLAMCTTVGLAVMGERMTAAMTAKVGGPKHAKLAHRQGNWHGSAPGSVVLGGRRVPVERPRGRSVTGDDLDAQARSTSRSSVSRGSRPPLGLWLGDTENKTVVTALLADLVARGLNTDGGLLVVIDGAKALAIAVRKVVADTAFIQRCTLHRSRKESSCRFVAAGCSGGEEFGGGAVTDGCRGWDAAVLFQEGPGFADGVADGGAADVAERVGEDVEGAQLPEMQDRQQDTFAVADLLGKDAAAGAGLAGAATSLVGAPLGVGGLPGREALGELVQLLAAHAGEGRGGQGVDDRGPGGAEVLVEEGEQVVGGGEPHRGDAGVVAVVFEDFAGLPDEAADAGVGDLQQVGQHDHGADLPLVDEGDQ